MVTIDAMRLVLMAVAWAAAMGLAASVAAEVRSDTAAGKVRQAVLEAQASRFWQTVAAEADDRELLLESHFSRGLRERNGDADLLKTFSMLADALGPELVSLPPATVLDSDQGANCSTRWPMAGACR